MASSASHHARRPIHRRPIAMAAVLLLVVGVGVAGWARFGEHEATCQPGYQKLSNDYVRELRGGASTDAQQVEGAGGDSGEEGAAYCLADGVSRPEPFGDLMKANDSATYRLGLSSPQTLERAVAQRARLTGSGIAGTAGTWTPVGNGPVVFDNPDYTNSNGLATGLSRASGRISAYAFDPASKVLYASVANGGVWRSTDRGQHWTSIGDTLPTQIVGGLGWTSAGGTHGTLIALTGDNAFGGYTYSGAGIYYSTDQGAHWTKAIGAPDGAMGFRVAVDPGKPSVVYAATGFGLYRSTNAGRSWADVALPTGRCSGHSTTRAGCFLANVVTDVAVRAADTFGHSDGAVTAAVGWRSGQRKNPDGSVQAPANGIYTSATGTHDSFTKVPDSAGFAPTVNVGRVSLGATYGPGQNHDYLYSVVQDAVLFNKGTVEGLDVPQEKDPVLGTCPTCTSTYLNGIYVSKDFGKTWTELESGTALEQDPTTDSTLSSLQALGFGPGIQSWYNNWVQPDPYQHDSNGVPTRVTFGLEEIWENKAAGVTGVDGSTPTTFKVVAPYSNTGSGTAGCILSITSQVCQNPSVTQAIGNTTHPDQHADLYLPPTGGSNESLVVGNDGGNYASGPVPSTGNMQQSDFGKGNQAGFNTLLPYSVAVAKDGTVYSGLQDNGTVKIDPTTHDEIEVYGGDGTFAVTDPNDGNQALVAPAGGSLAVTHDGGKTNASVYPNAESPQFLTPFALDDAYTSNSSEIYAARDIWISHTKIADINDSSVWTKVFDLGTKQHPTDASATPSATDPPNVTTAVAMSNGTAYAGFCGSCDPVKDNVRFHSGIATNSGGTWHIAAAAGLPQRLVNAVKIDPSDPNTIYVGLGTSTVRPYAPPHALGADGVDPNGGYVYKSTNGGASFTDITGDLPKAGVTSLQIVNGQLLAGTVVGAFAAPGTSGGTWGLLGSNLPAAPVSQIVVDPANDHQIYAASYGRGVYRYTLTDPPATCTDRTPPVSTYSQQPRVDSGGHIVMRGTARDTGCPDSAVARVKVSVARVVHGGCRYQRGDGSFESTVVPCRIPHFNFRATGTTTWHYTSRAERRGPYEVRMRAIDRAGNTETVDPPRRRRDLRVG